MLHVDDHIDDLFRRAAEDYPLNTDGADFNKVTARMEGDQDDSCHKKGNNKNFLHFLWLLLLVPLPWLCNEQPAEKPGDQVTAQSAENTATIPPEKTPAVKPQTKSGLNKTNGGMPEQNLPGTHKSNKNAVSHNQRLTSAKELALNAPPSNSNPLDTRDVSKNNPIHAGAQTTLSDPGHTNNLADPVLNSTDTTGKDQPAKTPALAETMDPAIKVKAASQSGKPGKLYAGVLVGADISFVDFQKIKDPGTSIGIIAGYAINKRLAIEGSAFLEKKSYFSTGEYFDKQRTSIPANYKIETVWGKCNMIDISLSGRYNAIVRPQLNWFITAGVSSYIMKKEDYYYTYRYNWQIMQRRLSYKNSTNNFFATANLGVGYSGKFQGNWQFRVEPYVKLPLTGIGIGNMRLMSAGVNAGLITPLFRR